MHLTHLSLGSFYGTYMQTVQTQISCRRMWRLIIVSNVCLQIVNGNEKPKIVNQLVQLIKMGKSIRHKQVKINLPYGLDHI